MTGVGFATAKVERKRRVHPVKLGRAHRPSGPLDRERIQAHELEGALQELEIAVERIARDGLKSNARCEPCVEALASVFFYRSSFGFARQYDLSLQTSQQGLAQFPRNARLSYWKGRSHFDRGEYAGYREVNAAFIFRGGFMTSFSAPSMR